MNVLQWAQLVRAVQELRRLRHADSAQLGVIRLDQVCHCSTTLWSVRRVHAVGYCGSAPWIFMMYVYCKTNVRTMILFILEIAGNLFVLSNFYLSLKGIHVSTCKEDVYNIAY